MSFEFWFMLPIAVIVASIAMASGVEGATFFAPIFILGLGLPVEVAIGTGLITEVFGFASGLYAYRKKGFIDYQLGLSLLIITIPLALIGASISSFIDANILKLLLGFGLFVIGLNFLLSKHKLPSESGFDFNQISRQQTCIDSAEGEQICYEAPNLHEGRIISGIGSLFMGMLGTGLGEMNGFFFLRRSQIPPKVAIATSVFVVAITALSASIAHLIKFIQLGDGAALSVVMSIVIFTAPGVVFGGQLGSAVASRISQKQLERAMAVLFNLVALLLLFDVLL